MNKRQQRVEQVISEYLRRRDPRDTEARHNLLRQHPELLPELAEALKRVGRIDVARQAVADAPVAPEAVETVTFCVAADGETSTFGLRIRCPNCRHHVTISPQDQLVRIHCITCGSDFGLADPDRDQVPSCIGHFQLQGCLGTGSFGAVFKAHDAELDRYVAIKLPRRGKLPAHEVQKFIDEARVVAQLNHPGIVNVHEVGRFEDHVYIVSDLIDGAPLTQKLTTGGVPCREAAELCLQMAEALAHAHAQNIVHRDLKPANILVDQQDRVFITDFGLAKHSLADVTVTADGHILGTPAYMAPEQAQGRISETDHRADIYSLGVILFELLTGERPFRGDARQLLQSVVRDEPPRLRSLRRTIPRDLETICLKCLEKSRERRYLSMSHLADDLRRWLRDEPVAARPAGGVERFRRWCRSSPLLAGLLLTTLLISLLTASGASAIAAARQRNIDEAVVELSLYRESPTDELQRIATHVAEVGAAAQAARLWGLPPENASHFVQEQYRQYGPGVARGVLTWFWLDAQGHLTAVYPLDHVLIGRQLAERDYFLGARRQAEPYISLPFRSENDGLFKFAVAVAVRDSEATFRGVVAASIATEASRAIAREERLVALLRVWTVVTLCPLLIFSFAAPGVSWWHRHRQNRYREFRVGGTGGNAQTRG